MKYLSIIAIISIFTIAFFLAGCAAQEISTKSDKEYEQESAAKTTTKTTTPTKTTTKTTTTTADEPEEEEEEHISVKESTTGDTVTLKKLGDPFRDKDVTEKCDLDFPFECSRYLAKDGIVYIAVKNQGYGSKVDEVTLYMKGDACDPAHTYIEPGQNKDFECFDDPDINVVSGSLEIEYYVPTKKEHHTKTGRIVVIME